MHFKRQPEGQVRFLFLLLSDEVTAIWSAELPPHFLSTHSFSLIRSPILSVKCPR